MHISALCPSGGLQFIFRRGIQSGSNEKQVEKFAGVKHKKVKQALGPRLRNLFKQLAGVFASCGASTLIP